MCNRDTATANMTVAYEDSRTQAYGWAGGADEACTREWANVNLLHKAIILQPCAPSLDCESKVMLPE